MRPGTRHSAGLPLVAVVLGACAGLGSGTVRGQVETPPIPMSVQALPEPPPA